METDRTWFIVRIDGKVAAISTDYRLFAQIAARLATNKCGTSPDSGNCIREISCSRAGFDEVWRLRQTLAWDDMVLFGTPFQKKVWKKLFELTHGEAITAQAEPRARLICYSDFAELCQNRAGVRAVAHAIGLNPVSVVIPCHLVIPK